MSDRSDRSDHVVVSFAAFVERRARRTRIAAELGEQDPSDVAVESPLAVAAAMNVVCGQAPSASEESE
jgi:hypothetical protein